MDPFIGQIICVGFNFAPPGWAQCNGQLLSIAQNNALFALLGTTYGGDGRTTFGLPDLRGRAPIGVGQGPGLSNYVQGQMGGTESVTAMGTGQFALAAANLPAHTHAIQGSVSVAIADQAGSSNAASGNVLGKVAQDADVSPATTIEMYVATSGRGAATFNDRNQLGGVSHNITTAATGTGTPVSVPVSVNVANRQPYLGMMYIIATQGIFPSRP